MKIFYLSNKNSSRSQMAEAILRHLDPDLKIYSAGIDLSDQVNDIAIEVMAEKGISMVQKTPQHYLKFLNLDFDYLITVGDGTQEQLTIPGIRYRKKMHLGFQNPYTYSTRTEDIRQKCREIRDEIYTEMEYFYNRILKTEKGNYN